jgi:DNA-directed RNA polymerase specialized sigma24 family protein
MNDFIFLANWYDVIKAYDDAGQEDMANAIAKEIIIYGATGDTRTTDPLIYGIVRGLCADQIKRPKSRSAQSIANGKKGGRPPKYDKTEIVSLYKQWQSEEDIAKQLGCSIKTVQRALMDADSDDEI